MEAERLKRFLELAREISYSGISCDLEHPAIDWIEVQVDKKDWTEFCRLAAPSPSPEGPD